MTLPLAVSVAATGSNVVMVSLISWRVWEGSASMDWVC